MSLITFDAKITQKNTEETNFSFWLRKGREKDRVIKITWLNNE